METAMLLTELFAKILAVPMIGIAGYQWVIKGDYTRATFWFAFSLVLAK